MGSARRGPRAGRQVARRRRRDTTTRRAIGCWRPCASSARPTSPLQGPSARIANGTPTTTASSCCRAARNFTAKETWPRSLPSNASSRTSAWLYATPPMMSRRPVRRALRSVVRALEPRSDLRGRGLGRRARAQARCRSGGPHRGPRIRRSGDEQCRSGRRPGRRRRSRPSLDIHRVEHRRSPRFLSRPPWR